MPNPLFFGNLEPRQANAFGPVVSSREALEPGFLTLIGTTSWRTRRFRGF